MSFFALALAAATQPSMAPPICRDARPRPVDVAEAARLRRLDKLPLAEAYLAVMRTENGCIRPVKVSEERARRR
jgi:hypothetical protein